LKFIPEKEKLLEKISGILDSGWLVQGKYNALFEEKVKKMTGAGYAVSCSNCTSGLDLVLRALPECLGKLKVIVPTNTFFATGLAVINAGYIPLVVDVNPKTMMLDLETIKDTNLRGVFAIINVSIGGWLSQDALKIEELCDQMGIYLIGDMAHAHDVFIDNIVGDGDRSSNSGTIGDAAVFSYFPTKVLFGAEGGCISTNNEELAGKLVRLRSLGKVKDGWANNHNMIGLNARLSNISACICDHIHGFKDQIIIRRAEIADIYCKTLKEIDSDLLSMHYVSGCEPNYYKFIVRGKSKKLKSLKKAFKKEDIYLPEKVFSRGMHKHNLPSHLFEVSKAGYKNFDKMKKNHLCLPMSHAMSNEDCFKVCDILKKWSRK